MEKTTYNVKTTRVVHVKKDQFDAYVGRKMPGIDAPYARFGNPFRLTHEAQRGSTLTDYLGYLLANESLVREARETIGHFATIACWCAPAGGLDVDANIVCHAQVLSRAMRGDYDGHYAPATDQSNAKNHSR